MTFSDAIPVQFWLVDCETYNEEERYGLNSRCFCAPWECDDEIKIQFQDDNDQNFSLLIYDDEDSLLDEIEIEETSAGVYLVAFTPSDNTPDFCDKNIQLKIRRNAGMQGFALPDFDEWVNDGGAGSPWTLGSNPSFVISGSANTEFLIVDFAFIEGLEYSLRLNYTATSNTLASQLDIYVLDSSNNILFDAGTIYIITSGSNSTDAVEFTATAASTRIGIRIDGAAFDSSTVTLNSVSALSQVGTDEVVAKSDCLSVKAEQVGTVLISYSNYRNYAGIINNNGSPDLTFYLRIPAVFNEERFPETDEVHQLSNNRFISLNSQVKKQRLLETDQMPNYMHLKIKEVLKHQFVTIEDKDYVKEEPYEQVENANKRWPMRRYTCWLTEKEYVVRNIL